MKQCLKCIILAIAFWLPAPLAGARNWIPKREFFAAVDEMMRRAPRPPILTPVPAPRCAGPVGCHPRADGTLRQDLVTLSIRPC